MKPRFAAALSLTLLLAATPVLAETDVTEVHSFSALAGVEAQALSQEEMDAMEDGERDQLLFEMSETRNYIAICKYLFARSRLTHDGLGTFDPLKNPSDILRSQGMISGLLDLVSAVELIREEKKRKADGVVE